MFVLIQRERERGRERERERAREGGREGGTKARTWRTVIILYLAQGLIVTTHIQDCHRYSSYQLCDRIDNTQI